MTADYDICVDIYTLDNLQNKLDRISHNLINSTKQMKQAITVSQGFLEGNQFDKAKRITLTCANITLKVESNIQYAKKYLDDLKEAVEEYNRCKYNGDAI